MIIVVKRHEIINGNYGEYLKVYYDKDGQERSQNINDKLKDKWELVQDGINLEIKMSSKEIDGKKKWFVNDISVPEGETTKQAKPKSAETKPVENQTWTKDDDIHRQTATKCAFGAVANGVFPAGHVFGIAYQIERYFKRELTPVEGDANIKQYLK